MNNCYYITESSINIPYSRKLFTSEMIFTSFVDRDGLFLSVDSYLERLINGASHFWDLNQNQVNDLKLFVYESWKNRKKRLNQYYRLSLIFEEGLFSLYFEMKENLFQASIKKLKTIELGHWASWSKNSKISTYADRFFFQKELTGEYNDYLRVNINQKVLEASSSNIFFIKKDKLITPLSDEVYSGVTASIFMNSFDTQQREIEIKELREFDSCFLLNGVRGFELVQKINQTEFDLNLAQIWKERFNSLWSDN